MFDAIYSLLWLHWHEVVHPYCDECQDLAKFHNENTSCPACPYYHDWKTRKEIVENYARLL